MEWTWDPAKNTANLRKHEIDFPTAVAVFDDPLAFSVEDPWWYEQRWKTVGMVASQVVVVVHTWPEASRTGAEPRGRIISARKVTSKERREYEEGIQ